MPSMSEYRQKVLAPACEVFKLAAMGIERPGDYFQLARECGGEAFETACRDEIGNLDEDDGALESTESTFAPLAMRVMNAVKLVFAQHRSGDFSMVEFETFLSGLLENASDEQDSP